MALAPRQLVVLGDSGARLGGPRGRWLVPTAPAAVDGPASNAGGLWPGSARRWVGACGGALAIGVVLSGELRRHVPDGVLLSVGLNDTAQVGRVDGRPQLSLEGFGFGMARLLDEMRQNCSVVLGLTPVDEHVMPLLIASGTAIATSSATKQPSARSAMTLTCHFCHCINPCDRIRPG